MNTFLASDGRRHVERPRIGPGRPPDVSEPLAALRRAVQRQIERLDKRAARLARTRKRWADVLAGLENDR
ncbi:hypothetical protein RB623_24270 [Mesorhizobium sp. LHD-90]|uniref:hypothetical protein n=1 Tax=Mesorhizobium sp. LHD-90 TaxID=3071414 RepID=UPI0027E14EE2|nr:hypothetical protein [Mesorhizobium sp. LHD-90]MDQ6437181.1 hypothetical protein [Mesorhizobium sp. LHD-90]